VVTVEHHGEATTQGAVAVQETVSLSGLTLCPSVSEASALNARDEVDDFVHAPIIPHFFLLSSVFWDFSKSLCPQYLGVFLAAPRA
jgi:hypothetical protein